MKVARTQVDANNPESVAAKLDETILVADSLIEFGDPQNPNDMTSVTRAGAASANHNGTVGNKKGYWAISVNGPWRLVLRVENNDIYDITLEQYH